MPGKKPKERQRYMLRVNDTLVEVTRAVYLAWYQAGRKERYQVEKMQRHGVCSMEELQEKGYDCSFSVLSPEEIIIRLSEIQELEEVDTTADVRYHTGVGELDRVLGGGLGAEGPGRPAPSGGHGGVYRSLLAAGGLPYGLRRLGHGPDFVVSPVPWEPADPAGGTGGVLCRQRRRRQHRTVRTGEPCLHLAL